MTHAPASAASLAPGDLRQVEKDAFNFQLASYIHPSWLGSLGFGDVVDRLRHKSRADPWLSKYLLRQFELDGEYWHDFETPWCRLALLPGKALATLAFHAGLWRYSRHVQRAVSGADVAALKRSLGAENYALALQWGAGASNAPLAHNEDKRGATVCAVSFANSNARDLAELCGAASLAALFGDSHRALKERVRLKLPLGWPLERNSRNDPGWRRQDATRLLPWLANECALW